MLTHETQDLYYNIDTLETTERWTHHLDTTTDTVTTWQDGFLTTERQERNAHGVFPWKQFISKVAYNLTESQMTEYCPRVQRW